MQPSFYAAIPPIHNIREITDAAHYFDVPADWYIALTDVTGSTLAIESGRYKEVCAVSAASIAAVLNVMDKVDIPFVFGGDGATLLVPGHLLEQVQAALAGTRKMAAEQFDLVMRIATVPVSDVLHAGYRIRVARLHVSDNFQQAIFSGGGLRYAESLLKHPQKGAEYAVPDHVQPDADFFGVECRWNQIPSAQDENVSLMVMALGDDTDVTDTIYHDVLEQIDAIYGDSLQRHPINIKDMQMTFKAKNLSVEGRIRHEENYGLKRLRKMIWNSIKARFAMWAGVGQWGSYKTYFRESTDNEKFDDTLRMVIAGTSHQREALTAYLDQLYQDGKLVYGMYTSGHALVTCIVYDYFGRQMHLVDGAEGGYTLAAKQMKAQLAALTHEPSALS